MFSFAQSFFFLGEKGEESIGQRRGFVLKTTTKRGKDGTMHVAKSPPKTFYENSWNYKHALSVVFHSNSSPKSSIIIFLSGVRFSSECKNKDFSLENFFPTSFLVPSDGIQESEDMSEYRRKKKSQHITPGPQKL